ncbi:hypothetical protein WG922_21390 [Ramlibacter sp. AN1015]|uniref:hypothetical protein n=1 Tax=Ramlibacter sp. AN1015 TaxID=3133428 RepID=UPI0030C63256
MKLPMRLFSEADSMNAPHHESAAQPVHSVAGASSEDATALIAEIVRLACKWYDTGIGKDEVALELAIAVMRYKRVSEGAAAPSREAADTGPHGQDDLNTAPSAVQDQPVTDKQLDAVLWKLDVIARSYDHQHYGLPLDLIGSETAHAALRATLRAALASSPAAVPAPQEPTGIENENAAAVTSLNPASVRAALAASPAAPQGVVRMRFGQRASEDWQAGWRAGYDAASPAAQPDILAVLGDAREDFERAIESLVDWAAYAPDYFKQKHDLDGTVAGHRAALARIDAVLKTKG